MSRFLSFLLALAVGRTFAAPHGSAKPLEKRQQMGRGLANLMKAQEQNKLGWYMGEPDAIEGLTELAVELGATRDLPGGIGTYTAKTLNAGWGPVAPPPGAVEAKVVEKTRTSVPGAQTVKIRYGPYKVPNMSIKNQLGEGGMLYNYPHTDIPKPCEGDCTILGITSGLEYPDGTNANIDTGMWLHHMVLFTVGPGREDATCGAVNISVPHATVGSTSRGSERIFASGNERSRGVYEEWGVKDIGYKLRSADKFAALVELMNQTPEDKTVFLTVTYDIVQGHPFKDDIKFVWFDVRQCGTSEVNPPHNQTKFTSSYEWTSNIEGDILGAIGHLHDGGTTTTLSVDGKLTCNSVASYGTKPDYIQKPMEGGHGHGVSLHISDMSTCSGDTFPMKQIKKGQKWDLKAHYDMEKYKGMAHDGELDAVMGIALLSVRTKGQ